MALNFPIDSRTLGFANTAPWLFNPNLLYGLSVGPDQDVNRAMGDYNNKNLPMWQRVGLSGPPSPNSQQPSIPIQSPQGSPPQQVASPNPPRLQSAPNSPALIGGSPNMALTNGGGYPMGGLPNQSPTQDLYSFNQLHSAPAMPMMQGPPDLQRMQRHQQNLQNFRQLLARLGGYSFQG